MQRIRVIIYGVVDMYEFGARELGNLAMIARVCPSPSSWHQPSKHGSLQRYRDRKTRGNASNTRELMLLSWNLDFCLNA